MQRQSSLYSLGPTQIHKLQRAKGATLWVIGGAVWLTEQGDRRDHLLLPTQIYRVRGHGMVLIGAADMRAIEFEIVLPPRAKPSQLLCWPVQAVRRVKRWPVRYLAYIVTRMKDSR